jgi:hypothetical protein
MKPHDHRARDLATSHAKDILEGSDGQGLEDFVLRAFPTLFHQTVLEWTDEEQGRWVNRHLVEMYEKLHRKCVKPVLRKPCRFYDSYASQWGQACNDEDMLNQLLADQDVRDALIEDLLKLLDMAAVSRDINARVVTALRTPRPEQKLRDDFTFCNPNLHHNPLIDAFAVAEWAIDRMRRNGKAAPAVQEWFLGMYKRMICGLGALIVPTGDRLKQFEANDDRRTDADQTAAFGNLLGIRLDADSKTARRLKSDPNAVDEIWSNDFKLDLEEPARLIDGAGDQLPDSRHAFWDINSRLSMHDVIRRLNRDELRLVIDNETVRITNLAGKKEPAKYVGLLECLIMMHFRAYSIQT